MNVAPINMKTNNLHFEGTKKIEKTFFRTNKNEDLEMLDYLKNTIKISGIRKIIGKKNFEKSNKFFYLRNGATVKLIEDNSYYSKKPKIFIKVTNPKGINRLFNKNEGKVLEWMLCSSETKNSAFFKINFLKTKESLDALFNAIKKAF